MNVLPPSMNVYALAGYISACRDYKTINDYVVSFLNNYCEYINCKTMFRKGEANKDDVDYYKERADNILKSLLVFVKRRKEEHWS